MNKILHYFYDDINIWERNAKPHFRMCYASWLKYCPDYEIKLWHVGMPEFKKILKDSKFVYECYKRKIWALIADYIRHYALYNYGGVYLDTDIQLVKSLDPYIEKPFFCSIEGDLYDGKNILESALIGGAKGYFVFKDLLDIYNSDEIFSIDYFIDPIVLSGYLNKKFGFEKINYKEEYKNKAFKFYQITENKQLDDYDLYTNQEITKIPNTDIEIYPSEYFCPTWTAFGANAFTDKTVAIHWNQSSWWKSWNELKHIESIRYENPLRKSLFLCKENIAKTVTCAIPNRSIRRKLRKKIISKLK